MAIYLHKPKPQLTEKQQLQRWLGLSVRNLRTQKKLRQKELATRIRSQQSVIARIESCNYLPTMYTLFRITKACGVELNVLFRSYPLPYCVRTRKALKTDVKTPVVGQGSGQTVV